MARNVGPPLSVLGLGREWYDDLEIRRRAYPTLGDLVASPPNVPIACRDLESCMMNTLLLRPLIKRMRLQNTLNLPHKHRLEEQLKVFAALWKGYKGTTEVSLRKVTFEDGEVSRIYVMATGIKNMIGFVKSKFTGGHVPRDTVVKQRFIQS